MLNVYSMLWNVNFLKIKGRIKIKKVVFWSILMLITALLVEMPFRIFDYWGGHQFKRAQTALTVASEKDLHEYYDTRTIVDQFPSGFLRNTVTDIINLNHGGYTEYPDFSLFTERKPYFMFRLNNMNFRGPDWHIRKEKGEIRVFLVGGSTSFSFFMDEEHSIHRQLEEFLNQNNTHPDKYYKVYSAGVPAMNTFGELEVIRQFVLPYKPDIVVALNGYNDMVIDKIPLRDGNLLYRSYRYLASTPTKLWVRHSAALKFLADKVSLWVRARVKFYKEVDALAPDEVVKVYSKNIAEMRRIVEANDSKFVVYRQPTLLAPGGKDKTAEERRVSDWWASGHEVFYKNFIEAYPLLDEYLIEHDFNYINGQDLGKFGLWGEKTAGGDPLFIDNAHLNIAGYRMIADEIAQYILKRSW